MADNITFQATPATPASGTVVSADELAGPVYVQNVKLMDGTSASTTVIASGNGVHGNALRVTIASDSTGPGALESGGNLAACATSLSAIDTSLNNIEADADTIAGDTTEIAATLATPTTVYNGQNTVAAAGTQEALAATQAIKSVTIKALATNSANIYVGDSNVASTTGFVLAPGESVSLDLANLDDAWIDADTTGDGVSYLAVG